MKMSKSILKKCKGGKLRTMKKREIENGGT